MKCSLFSIFPTVVELQALMKFYDKGSHEKNRLIDYEAFVAGLRLPLEGRRLAICK